METARQTYKTARIDDLTPHPKNPRQGDVGAIHESIETNGFYGALIVQKKTGHVLAGNHRLAAARHAGALEVPVLEIDCDDETATRILLADNRANDLADYDTPSLAALLLDLNQTPDGLVGTCYTADDLDELLADLNAAPIAKQSPKDDETPDGYQRLAFTLPDDAAVTVKNALEHARPTIHDEDVTPDAAALTLICAAYLTA